MQTASLPRPLLWAILLALIGLVSLFLTVNIFGSISVPKWLGSETFQSASTTTWIWKLPPHFPKPLVNPDKPMSAEKVDLGRYLFYDKRLSGNGSMSCASCHHQEKAFTDGLARAIGSTGEQHPRGAQSLVNMVYHTTLTWMNPTLVSLERQMLVPIFGDNPVEMGVTDKNKDEVFQRISADPLYQAKFEAAYPDEKDAVHWQRIVEAIAAFQMSLISANSRYDQYLQGKTTLSAQELRGKKLFFRKQAQCFQCHGSFNFNDQVKYAAPPSYQGLAPDSEARKLLLASQDALPTAQSPFHNTGLYNVGDQAKYPEDNPGMMEFTGRIEDMGKFRAPTLRNIEVTAPYMHDGSVNTLEEVLANYAAGGRNVRTGPHKGDGRRNPNKSPFLNNIQLTQAEQTDIIAFLKTLTDKGFLNNPAFSDPFTQPRSAAVSSTQVQ